MLEDCLRESLRITWIKIANVSIIISWINWVNFLKNFNSFPAIVRKDLCWGVYVGIRDENNRILFIGPNAQSLVINCGSSYCNRIEEHENWRTENVLNTLCLVIISNPLSYTGLNGNLSICCQECYRIVRELHATENTFLFPLSSLSLSQKDDESQPPVRTYCPTKRKNRIHELAL